MKKITLSILIVAVAALALTGIVLAQDPTPPPSTPYGGGRHGGGMTDGGLLHDYMAKYLAEAFDMSEDELNARLAEGERMADIAYGLGYTAEDFTQIMNEARLSALDDALSDGVLTQEQYDFMQARGQGGQGMGSGSGNGGRGGGGGKNHQPGGGTGMGDCPYYTDTTPTN